MLTKEDVERDGWKVLYPRLAELVRAYLATVPEGESRSTATLVGALCALADIDTKLAVNKAVVKRLFHAIQVLAQHDLSDCCARDKPRVNGYKQVVRPWRWFRPKPHNGPIEYIVTHSQLNLLRKIADDQNEVLTWADGVSNSPRGVAQSGTHNKESANGDTEGQAPQGGPE